MARTAYWIANPTSSWESGTLTGAHIAAGLMADGATSAEFNGSEAFTAEIGTGTITESTATSGATPGIEYTVAWVIYDDVAANYSGVEIDTITTYHTIQLSAPTATDITATGARGRVTATEYA